MKLGMGVLAGSMMPMDAIAAMLKQMEPKRILSFYNIHTGERIEVCYSDAGGYRTDALIQIDHVLRDYRTGEVNTIDTDLLDLLYAVKCRMQPNTPFSVISGYRSPVTNERLRRSTSGVAKKSFHTKGQAIDIRLPGYSTAQLRKLAVKMKAGGVGYYPRSDFVHIDIGPVRTW